MPRMTKANRKRYLTLNLKLDLARDAVFAVMHPRKDVRFSECYKAAPDDVKKRYDDAKQALADFEYQMVNERRAWSASYGLVSY